MFVIVIFISPCFFHFISYSYSRINNIMSLMKQQRLAVFGVLLKRDHWGFFFFLYKFSFVLNMVVPCYNFFLLFLKTLICCTSYNLLIFYKLALLWWSYYYYLFVCLLRPIYFLLNIIYFFVKLIFTWMHISGFFVQHQTQKYLIKCYALQIKCNRKIL